jgi:hypothetical protein
MQGRNENILTNMNKIQGFVNKLNLWIRAGLQEGADVAVGEDHRGGTVSQESDVTDTAFGRKGTAMHR